MHRIRALPLLLLLLSAPAFSAEPGELSWDTWERLPVLEGGRRMPLDTYARTMAQETCGREQPKLWLAEEKATEGTSSREAAAVLFPDGKPRRFRASELIFSWLAEPERWQAVPLLVADHKQLREVLDLPRFDEFGRLRHISLLAAQSNAEFFRRLESLTAKRREAAEARQKWEPHGVDRAVEKLEEAYVRFEKFTHDPRSLGQTTDQFRTRRNAAMAALEEAAETLRRENRMTEGDPAAQRLVAAAEAFENLLAGTPRRMFSWDKTERDVVALRGALEALRRHCAAHESARLALLATEAARQAHEAHLALYDAPASFSLRLVPALNPAALEPDREPEDDAQPWLGFGALIHGSDELLAGYPQAELKRVRRAWADVKAAYLDRGNPQRPARFAEAMDEFAAAVRQMGEAVTPLRDDLPLRRRDDKLLADTAYPPPDYTDTEVFYNRLNPFFWSWVVGLVSVFCLAMTFGWLRRPMFWLGLIVLVAAQAIIVWGFGLRMAITGLVPLTNMFETVVFVGLCVPLFGLWFTLLPIFWPGLSAAWRATSAGLLWDRPDEEEADRLLLGRQWPAAAMGSLLVRVGLIAPVFLYTSRYVSLSLDMSGTMWQRLGELMVWLVAFLVVLSVVYYVPRLVPTFALAMVSVPRGLARSGWAGPRDEAIDRRAFALVGAAVGTLTAVIAYFAPDTVMTATIANTQPILRDNFWLFVHVLTISASYGAGALAWGLSNIAMAYFLFGKYSRPASAGGNAAGVGAEGRTSEPPLPPLPPPECATLARYSYKALQVAVLLLAAGTILGALWADKAWGHFWSWDSKEVWSLLTLLAYMAILHARHIGWVGSFGMAFGSVLGATFIITAWYGVNYLLPAGKHSYGGGAGGQWHVGIAVALNWLFVLAAAVRYNVMRDAK